MGSSSQNTNTTNSSNTNYNGTSSSAPGWMPQVQDLTTAFSQANGALSKANGYSAAPGTDTNFDTSGTFNNGSTLNSAGTNATTGALSGLSGFDPTKLNNTGSLIDAANSYVAGQNIPAQVAQATQQAREQARDVTMPGIEQGAAMTGNTNSSRTGIADGLVERGLAENAQNLSGALSSQAFSNGLTLASNNANSNNTSSLGALSTAATAGTNAANSGASNEATAVNTTGAQNTNNQSNFSNSVNNAYAALANYMKLIGSNNWGSTTNTSGNSASNGTGTSNTVSTPSMMSQIGQGIGILGTGLDLLP